jgi:long-chain acyl-CoA synthetase
MGSSTALGVGEAVHQPTLVDAWRATAQRLGDAPLIRYFDTTITAATVREQANALAVHLGEAGLKPADRVAVCLQNDPAWLITLIGVWQAGLVVVPINPMVRQRELAHYLIDSGSRVLVTTGDYLEQVVNDVLDEVELRQVIVADPPAIGEGDAASADPSAPVDPRVVLFDSIADRFGQAPEVVVPVSHDDLALLCYTSGTTGPPKGAMNTHGNLKYSAEVLTAWYGLGPTDVIWGIAPFFHITGITTELNLVIQAGLPLVMFHRFEPAVAMRYLQRWKATYCVGAITAFIAMMGDPTFAERDLSSLTKIYTGGAPVSPPTVERFEALTGGYIRNGFGLTESTGPATFTSRDARAPIDAESGTLSCGVPCRGCTWSSSTRRPVSRCRRGSRARSS